MFKNTLQQSSGSNKLRSNLNSVSREVDGKRAVTPEPYSDIIKSCNWKDRSDKLT